MTRFNLKEAQQPPVINVTSAVPDIHVAAPKMPKPVDNARELQAIAAAVTAFKGVDLSDVVAAIEKNTAALEVAKGQMSELKESVDAVSSALLASKTVTRDRNGLITKVQVNGDY